MENIKLEAKAYEDLLTISALTEKKETIIESGYKWLKKTPVIENLGTFKHLKKNGITVVKVIPNHQNRSDEIINPHLPKE